MHLKFLLFPLVCYVCQADAQQLNTDRPDQSDGASVVDKRVFQLETSFYYTVVNKSQTAYISSSLLRYGVAKNTELRLLAEQGQNRDLFLEEGAHSQFPLALSAKFNVTKNKPSWPDLSVAGYLQMPFTNGDQPHQWSSAIFLIAEKKWEPVTVTINIGPKQEPFSPEWSLQATGDIKFELSEHLQIFGEYFSQFGKALPFHNVDGGCMFFLNDNWMLHLSAGTSIEHRPSVYFVNTGFAVKMAPRKNGSKHNASSS